MDDWIESLWQEAKQLVWGDRTLLGIVWDLSCLADSGMIDPEALDSMLVERELAYWKDLAGSPNPNHGESSLCWTAKDHVLGTYSNHQVAVTPIDLPIACLDRSTTH